MTAYSSLGGTDRKKTDWEGKKKPMPKGKGKRFDFSILSFTNQPNNKDRDPICSSLHSLSQGFSASAGTREFSQPLAS